MCETVWVCVVDVVAIFKINLGSTERYKSLFSHVSQIQQFNGTGTNFIGIVYYTVIASCLQNKFFVDTIPKFISTKCHVVHINYVTLNNINILLYTLDVEFNFHYCRDSDVMLSLAFIGFNFGDIPSRHLNLLSGLLVMTRIP